MIESGRNRVLESTRSPKPGEAAPSPLYRSSCVNKVQRSGILCKLHRAFFVEKNNKKDYYV